DLMLFYEDDSKLLLPTITPSIIISYVAVRRTSRCVQPLRCRTLVLQELVGTKAVHHSAARSFETLTTLLAFWPSSEKEFIRPDLRLSKSDSTFCNLTSVETLYVSPSFKTFDPVTKFAIISNASGGTSSFSTLSVSSPESASPEKSVHLLSPVLAGPSFRTWSRQQFFSISFKEKDEPARVPHPFASGGPVSSDAEENDNLNLQEILPDNSDSAKNKISDVLSSNWVKFCTQNRDHFTSVSCPSFQTTRGPPREPEANNSIKVLLGEVKNAIVKLDEDLSMVIQELNVISGHLVSLSGKSPQISTSVQFPQAPEGSSEQI
ncbi:hypothetical protein MC885_006552, partial [Smutsia gigantea]